MAESSGAFPLASFYFRVEFENFDGEISFQEVTGLEETAEVLEYRDGTSKLLVTQKRAGLMKASTVTMKRGIFKDKDELVELFTQLQGKSFHPESDELLNITVSLMEAMSQTKGEDIMIWKIYNAFPIKLSGPTLKSDSKEVAIESIQFALERITIEQN